MTALFSMRGCGQFSAAIVSVVVVSAFKVQIQNDDPVDPVHVDFVWRLIIGLACVPATIALYTRLTIIESPRLALNITRNAQQATQDVNAYVTAGSCGFDAEAVRHRAEAPRASRREFVA
jgi:PHS family inorganic phosphate transporter-like MFS transporter